MRRTIRRCTSMCQNDNRYTGNETVRSTTCRCVDRSTNTQKESKQRKQKRNKWSKQCNKERGKEKNSKRYKTLQQTQQFGNVIHQMYIKANVLKNDWWRRQGACIMTAILTHDGEHSESQYRNVFRFGRLALIGLQSNLRLPKPAPSAPVRNSYSPESTQDCLHINITPQGYISKKRHDTNNNNNSGIDTVNGTLRMEWGFGNELTESEFIWGTSNLPFPPA